MVQLTLPKNSKVQKGKTWNAPTGDKSHWGQFDIYRWDPETGENPRVDTYYVNLQDCGPMVLDALIKIKNEIDPTLSFRRSCREGICGSCAMNINGTNTLACTLATEDVGNPVRIYPLPHMDVMKDLVPDLTHFFAQHRSIEPWLKTDSPAPVTEWLQSREDRAAARRSLRMHSVCVLHDGVPLLLVERRTLFGTGFASGGPALGGGQPRRVNGQPSRQSRRSVRLYRCHTITNCAQVCPKGLNPAKAIAELKRLMVERQL